MLPNDAQEGKPSQQDDKDSWIKKIKLKFRASGEKGVANDAESLRVALEECQRENEQLFESLTESVASLSAARDELVYATASSKYLNHEAFLLRDELHKAKREVSYLKLRLSDKEKEKQNALDVAPLKEKIVTQEKELEVRKLSLERASHASHRLTEANKAFEKRILEEKEKVRILTACLDDYKRILSKHYSASALSEEMQGGLLDAIESEQPGSTSFAFPSQFTPGGEPSLKK